MRNPWSKLAAFHWKRWGRPLYEQGEPIAAPLQSYVRHTYEWAFNSWGDVVWQEFGINGAQVGAPQFIVNVSQSPNYPDQWFQREFLSIWNQAWFSSLRSASTRVSVASFPRQANTPPSSGAATGLLQRLPSQNVR